MIRTLRKVAIASILSMVTATANATLIDNDIYTTDTDSGLDWLDLTVSANQSYNYVSNQFGSGGAYEGWEYATSSQLVQLIMNSGYTSPISTPGLTKFDEVNNISLLDTLMPLLGATNGESTTGMLLDLTQNDLTIGTLNNFDNSGGGWDYMIIEPLPSFYSNGKDDSNPKFGSFLVRSTVQIPEPATVSLFGLGLLGLGYARKRKLAG